MQISLTYTRASISKIAAVKNHTIKITDLAEVQPLVNIFTCNQIEELHHSAAGLALNPNFALTN